MQIPDYIDNQHHTLAAILTDLIQSYNERKLDIVTGYFLIEARLKLEDAMNQLTQLRLSIGCNPTNLAAERDRQ
jgi:hypothetical protein